MMLNEGNDPQPHSTKKVGTYGCRSKSPLDRSKNPIEKKNVRSFEESYQNSHSRPNISKNISPHKKITEKSPSNAREDYKR